MKIYPSFTLDEKADLYSCRYRWQSMRRFRLGLFELVLISLLIVSSSIIYLVR